MESRTQNIITKFEEDEELQAMALAEVIELMAHEYRVESTLENAAMEAGLLNSGGRIDWSQVVGFFRERAEAEFIRNELRRNLLSEEPNDEVLADQEAMEFDILP